MRHYRFCPVCGGRLTSRREAGSFDCAVCGRPLYENSKPCSSALVERDGKLLLVRRAIEPFRGYWDIPGGFLAPGEHPTAGAAREVLEETGLVVVVGELLGIWMDTYDGRAGDPPAWTLSCYYLAEPIGGEPRPGDDAAELGWFRSDELPDELAFHGAAVVAAWRERRRGTLAATAT